MSITIYGIKNCDTMKKAFAWLDGRGLSYAFHDYKQAGIDSARLEQWCAQVGWQALVNTRGTTWRRLAPQQQAIGGSADAVRLMAANTSLIKRPVIETARGLLVGFDAARYAEELPREADE
jgi:Spx/MgsR family transcriptional regulator